MFKRSQRRRGLIVVLCVTSATTAVQGAPDSLATPADLAAAKTMADAVAAKPPFSFVYDGKPSADVLGTWQHTSEDKKLDANRTQTTMTWKDGSGLTARLVAVRYADFPAIEWTAFLKNDGTADSKLIEKFRGIDATIGQAPTVAGAAKHKSWNAARDFPKEPGGGAFEVYRGWVGAWKPLAADPKVQKRFSIDGNAPWVAVDSTSGGVTLMPAQGIEPATDAAGSGKSPGLVFKAPADGVYRVKGTFTHVGTGGDGVEFVIADFENRVYASGPIDAGKSAAFDQQLFLTAGSRVALTVHSRSNPENDQTRVNCDVTQLTDVATGDVVMHAMKGSDARDSDFQPLDFGIGADKSFSLASAGGRPTDGVAQPYFNVQMPQASALVAIGWPGQWDATFARTGDEVHLSAGQENVRTILRPGEEIRTPLMAVVNYTGDDAQRGQNLWRRWMVAHNLPRVNGKILGPSVAANSSHEFAEMIKANEKNQIEMNDRYAAEKMKLDYWWMDAGWYVNNGEWVNTGTWKVDRDRFPGGLRTISDHIKTLGVKALVWFEPERVTPGTELYDQHPNFLLRSFDPNDPMAGMVLYSGGAGGAEPLIAFNPTGRERVGGVVHWKPKMFTLHPGPKGEYAVARYTAPADGAYKISTKYAPGDPRATTDVHVIAKGQSLFDEQVVPESQRVYDGGVTLKKGEAIDFVVGCGSNNDYACDTTSLLAVVTAPDGKTSDVAADLKAETNPNGVWTYGALPPGEANAASAFVVMNRQESGIGGAASWKLLNLGNPEARKWIIERVDSILKSEQIPFYRQDFNIEPLNFWRGADASDRQGFTENQYVQGYLAYWDELVARNPGTWIDSCASGGRRNDLETLRRATPLLRSDRLFAPVGQQSHAYGIANWMPANGTGQLVGKSEIFQGVTGSVDMYVLRSCMTPELNLCIDVRDTSLDYNALRGYLSTYREIGDDYFGDYYPLTPHSLSSDAWMAWQFHSADKNEGFVQAFRRPDAPESMTLKWHGLDPAARYTLTDVDHADQTVTVIGADLLAGREVKITAKPGAVILRYKAAR